MENWSSTTEFMAFILVAIMILQVHVNRMAMTTSRQKLFMLSLYLCAASILLSAPTSVLTDTASAVPRALVMACGTLYFVTSVGLTGTVTLYLFDLLLEHVYSKRCLHASFRIVVALNVAFWCLMVVNLVWGLVFSFDNVNGYARGPLGAAGYGVLAVEVVMVVACYVRHRASVSLQVKRVIKMVVPLVIALAVFQAVHPGLLLSGTIGSLTLLVGLLNFQSRSVGDDSLTLVGDRKSMNEELLLRTASSQPFHIVSVSLCDFASVNRRIGHRSADELLYQAATWLSGIDEKGRVFRYGKVSFAIVRPYCGEEDAERTLHEVDTGFGRPWPLSGDRCMLKARCCSLVRKGQDWDPERIITYLDALKERAKRERLRVIRFDKALEQEVDRHIYLAEVLVDAMDNRRFVVHYQPIVSCATGQFHHAEALLRLNDREGAAVPPSEFIPLAEKMGLVDRVSWIALEQVCTFLREHPDLPLRAVSVNLSMPQLLDPQLDERIEDCLREYGIATSRLKIEITERMVVEHEQAVADMLRKLADAGIGCYLDDFGTGYSNFSLVMRLPLECVKLDRSLLLNIASSEHDRNVVARLVGMLHAMGPDVSAVWAAGADSIQGFLYAKPMDADALVAFLEGRV